MNVINTRHGEIRIRSGRWGGLDLLHMPDNLDIMVGVSTPRAGDPTQRAYVQVQNQTIEDEADLGRIALLSRFALDIAYHINKANAESAKAILEAEAEQEAQREKREEAEKQRSAEREERLMHEFVGDEVRIRHKGYKTMCYAFVQVREVGHYRDEPVDPEYQVRMKYKYQGDTRDFGVKSYQRVDIKTEKGWKS